MHDNIISQNIKLLDDKLIFENIKKELEIIDIVKNKVLNVTREFTPIFCRECGCLVPKTKEYVKRKVKTFLTMIIQL